MNPAELDSAIGLFFLAWRAFTAGRDRELGALGLGQVHHRLLFLLARMPNLSVGTLAATLGISRQALHRPLRELLERGLVVSAISGHSGRERALNLTPSGQALEQRATVTQHELLGPVLQRAGIQASRGWLQVMRDLAQGPMAELPPAVAQWAKPGFERGFP